MTVEPCVLQGAKYVDRLKYQETQPTHKKGFQTSDFSRRDEFSMTFRTEQYRTLLKQVSLAGILNTKGLMAGIISAQLAVCSSMLVACIA